MVRVNLRGFRAVDRRTVASRSAMAWRSELLADLGGAEALSAARMALVESATRSWLFIQHVDAWCLEQTSLVNARKRAVHPVLRERAVLVEQLQRSLVALGLDRAAPKAETLGEIAARLHAERELQDAPRSHEGAREAAWTAPQAEVVEPGVTVEPSGGLLEQAEQPQAERPAVTLDVAELASRRAAALVLGTWSAVLPEQAPEPVEVPDF